MNLNSKINGGESLYHSSLYTPDNDERQLPVSQYSFDDKEKKKKTTVPSGSSTGVSQEAINSALDDMAGVRSRLEGYSRQKPTEEQVGSKFTNTVKGLMVPKATPERRLQIYSQSDAALDDAFGGSFSDDMKTRLNTKRQESKEKTEKAYREEMSVVGADPEAAYYRAMENDDAVKDVEATIEETDVTELLKRVAPLAKHGGYEIDEYLNERVIPKMYDTLLDEVIEGEKPKSSAEYILRSSLTNSLLGKAAMLGRDIRSLSRNQTLLQGQGLERYDANRLERFAGNVGSLLVDAPLFSRLGRAGSVIMGGVTSRLTSNLAGRILARKFGEGMTRQMAKDVATRIVTNRIGYKILQSAGTQGFTLGNYDAMNSVVDDLLYNSDIEAGKAAGSFAKGLLTGATLGVVGTPLREASKGLTGAKKLFASSGVLSAESAVFTAGSELEKIKNDVELTPIDLLYDFGESAATLLVMRMTHWRPKGASLKLDANGRLKDKFALSSSERAELKELNVNPEQFIEAVEKELKLPSFGGERARYIKDTYSSIMTNENLSAATRAKLLFLVENKVTTTPPIPFDFTVKQREDSKWEITTVDEVGRTVSRNVFDHAGNAKSYLMVHAADFRRNRIALFEMELTNGFRSANFIRQAGIYAKSNAKNIDEISTAIYKKSAGLEMSEQEQKIINDILERASYDEAGIVQMLHNVRRKIEKRHGLEKGTMFINIHEPFYRLSKAQNASLDEYEALLRDEVDRLKGGTDRRRSARLLRQGLDSDYFGMSNDEVKAKEIQDHYDWVAVRDADRVGFVQKSYSAGPPRLIQIPQDDNSGYVWSYGEAKNTREDIALYRERAQSVADRFGVKLNFISDEREIERPSPDDYEAVVQYNTKIVSNGWINMGRVFINLPNAKNVEDVERTVLHEVVGHKGLMHVFGEHLYDFLEDVYKKASPEVLRGINRIKYQYRGFDNYTVMEEYLAYLSEGTNLTRQERSLYVKIKDYIRSLLIRMNIYTGSNRQISEAELKDIMQRHCEYLQTKENPQNYRKDVFGSFKASHKDAKTYYSHADYVNEMKSLIDKGKLLSSTPKFFRNAKEILNYDLLPPEQQKRVRERNGIVEESAQNPTGDSNYRIKKATSSERSGAISGNSSAGGLHQEGNGHLSHYALTLQDDAAKLQQNMRETKTFLRNYYNYGGFKRKITTPQDAVRALGETLHLRKSNSSHSYYGEYLDENNFDDYSGVDGKKIKLRISTHPANNVRMGNSPADDKISIVVYKDGEHVGKDAHNGYTEFYYNPNDISPADAARAIIDGVHELVNSGNFIDYTGKAKIKKYPYYENGELHYRIPEDEKTSFSERSDALQGYSDKEYFPENTVNRYGDKLRYRLPDDIYNEKGYEDVRELDREQAERGTAYEADESVPVLKDPFFRSLRANSPTYSYVYEHLRGLPIEKWEPHDHTLWDTLVDMAEGGAVRFVLKDIVTDNKFLEEYPELAMVPVSIEKNLSKPVMYDKQSNRILLDKRVYLYPQSKYYIDAALRSVADDFDARRMSAEKQVNEFNSRFTTRYENAVTYAEKLAKMREFIPDFDVDNRIAQAFMNEYGFMPEDFLKRFPTMDDYLLYRVTRSMSSFIDERDTPEARKSKEKMIDKKIGKHRKFFWGPVEIIMDAAGSANGKGPLRVATKKDHENDELPSSGLDYSENGNDYMKYLPGIFRYFDLPDPTIELNREGREEYLRKKKAREKAEKEKYGIHVPKSEEEKLLEQEREKQKLKMN